MKQAELEAIVAKLAEAQRKTEEVMREERRKTEEAQRKTDASIDRLIEEHRTIEEAQRTIVALIDRLSEEHRKTEDSMYEMRRKAEESMLEAERRKTEEIVRLTQKDLDGMGYSPDEIAVEMFSRTIPGLCAKPPYNMHFDRIRQHVNLPYGGDDSEYDIVALNDEIVLIVEVKEKLQKENVEHLVRKLVNFRTNCPDFKDHTVIGAVAGLVMPKDVQQIAEKLGLFVFIQATEDDAAIANHAGFTPRKY